MLISLIRQITSLLLDREAEDWGTGDIGAAGGGGGVQLAFQAGVMEAQDFVEDLGMSSSLFCVLPQIQLSSVH